MLTQPGLTQGPATNEFNEYKIGFNVLPYPEAGRQIPKGDYRLQITVSKK